LGLHIGRQDVELVAQQRLQISRDRAVFQKLGLVGIFADLGVQGVPVSSGDFSGCGRGLGRGGRGFRRRRRFGLAAGGQRQGDSGGGHEGQTHGSDLA